MHFYPQHPTFRKQSLRLILGVLLVFVMGGVRGQVNIFNIETMLNGTAGANGASIESWETNNRFENDALTMSGTGDMRNTSVSSGYPGASGTWNVMLNAYNETFRIEGINTLGYNTIKLSFGIKKNTKVQEGSGISIEVSPNGNSWTLLSMPALPTGSGTDIWHYRTCSGSIPTSTTLFIRFKSTSSEEWRIDDIRLTGIFDCNVDITSFIPNSGPPGTLVNIIGANFTGASNVFFNGIPAAFFTVVSPSLIQARVPSGANTGKISVLNGCTEYSVSDFTVYGNYCPYGGTNLIISELCDPQDNYKTDRYIEIYNPTNVTIPLNGWQVRAISNGEIEALCDDASVLCWYLVGEILPGQAKTCGYTSPVKGGPHDFTDPNWTIPPNSGACYDWNGQYQDGAALYDNNNVRIDAILRDNVNTQWYHDRSIIRNAAICNPNPSSPYTEWTVTETVVLADSPPATPRSHTSNCGGDTPTVDTHPQNQSICEGKGPITFSVLASGGASPNDYQYKWYVHSGVGNWLPISNVGNYSGALSANLVIDNVPLAFNNYQYYCEVYNNDGLCYQASDAAQLKVNPVPTTSLIYHR